MSLKKKLLINTSMRMFYMHGIHAVGINEILKESGIAKKTLYHHFRSKDELIVATLIQRDQNFIEWFDNSLMEVTPGKAALRHVFIALNSWFKSEAKSLGEYRGCFFINASAEYHGENSEISDQCKKHKLQVRELIYQHAKLVCHSTSDADELTDAIFVIKEGCISTSLVQQDLNIAKKILPVIDRLLLTYCV
jgi:AcrR family transcriptional regulator